MKEINLASLDIKVYKDTLENGLDIYYAPYDDKKNYYISYATKFGSDILSFDYDNKKYTPPLGIAHYLEHKMFEMENKEDPFTFFSKSGTSSNAMTSYDSTKYICYGTKNFEENLKYLLTFVNKPYFTDENVEKEKGIIAEEIKMYDDIPDYRIEKKLKENIYHTHPRKYDIAGDVESIKKITKDDLYKCYNSFYTPNNMFIIITGNFDIDKASHTIKEELKSIPKKDIPNIYKVDEEVSIVKNKETINEKIEIPKIGIGLKIPKLKMNDIEQDLYLGMIATLLFGASSEFRERVRKKELLNDIYLEWERTDDYRVLYINVTTTKPNSLLEEINEEFSAVNISEKSFERIKKVWIANEVKSVDNINSMQSKIYGDVINYNDVISNKVELIRKMSINKLNKIIKDIDFNNRSTLVVLKKEQ